jgi:hypothetical protein
VVDAVGEEVELTHAAREVEVVLAAIPVLIDGRHDLGGESTSTIPRIPLGGGEICEHRVVVGVEGSRGVV